jgi:hypothetical protein
MMGMRIASVPVAAALVVLTALAADAATSPPTVHCSAVMLRPQTLDGSHRVVLGHVAFSRSPVFQVADVGGPLRYSSRWLLFVHPGRGVTIGVPPAWRTRAAVSWGGTGVVPAVRFERCPTPPNLSPGRWNGYVGRFHVREPGCVPLRIRAGGRSTTVRFGVGRPC